MARIRFRQGIVDYPKNTTSGDQEFLDANGTSVDLMVNAGNSTQPVVMTFIHGSTDYLYTERNNITGAWSGMTPGETYYLYWEIDLGTGHISRGQTDREPIISSKQPPPPKRVDGQMWFDTTKNIWQERNGSAWLPVLRVFAAKYLNTSSFESMSITANTDDFSGTQVGSLSGQRTARSVGSLVYNASGKAIKSGIGSKFFTTEDEFLAGVPTSASLRIGNRVISGRAACPIAAFQVVEFTDYDEICVANPAKQGERVFGIVEEDVTPNEIISIVTEGLIYNEAWDWEAAGADINAPVYINATGELSLSKTFAGRPAVGVVMGTKEIYFAPKLFPEITIEIANNTGGGGLSQAQLDQLNDNTANISTLSATTNSLNNTVTTLNQSVATAQSDITQLQSDVTGKLNISGGTLTGNLILNAAPTQDNQASTKKYVDDRLAGKQIDFGTGVWNVLGSDIQYQISAAAHTLPLNIYYDVIVFDSNGNRVGISYNVNTTTGLITISTAGSPFAGTVRIS